MSSMHFGACHRCTKFHKVEDAYSWPTVVALDKLINASYHSISVHPIDSCHCTSRRHITRIVAGLLASYAPGSISVYQVASYAPSSISVHPIASRCRCTALNTSEYVDSDIKHACNYTTSQTSAYISAYYTLLVYA